MNQKYLPKVGDIVKVDVEGSPGVGMVLEAHKTYVLVDGVYWRERFDIDGVKYIEETEERE